LQSHTEQLRLLKADWANERDKWRTEAGELRARAAAATVVADAAAAQLVALTETLERER